ncbi:hypothetical protein B0181_09500 [Moraxella caviae]|uniref:Uncharacterized protein n=1 Tax=Moraxella caviae TaxID=34060 RepID=A0A1S9ZWH8_9GAMM|nr:hypothetical protein [Moraxella caviae]OOR87783.1 hypothetical protein B0181_09500 [Moraxella caviae]STZ10537.1 Uncharacterised protein [Moraxella caviae]VEW11338.1 Uncharacterised protein [Moraxella caviae]
MNPAIIQRIKEAIALANLSVRLGLAAIVCFCVFGTLASLAAFKDSALVYYAFHYLPYALIAVSIPISLYHAFLLARYRIIQAGILKTVLAVGVGLLMFALAIFIRQGAGVVFFMGLFLAMIAWFGMPFLFRVNFKKFLTFLEQSNLENRSEKCSEKHSENA